eukprot:2797545-Pyramimonas_sp.AAC.1
MPKKNRRGCEKITEIQWQWKSEKKWCMFAMLTDRTALPLAEPLGAGSSAEAGAVVIHRAFARAVKYKVDNKGAADQIRAEVIAEISAAAA